MSNDIPNGTYNVELGKSFQNKKPSSAQESYTSMKYDFKPSSVSDQPETYIAVGNNGDVHVAMESDNLTIFKGSKKEAKKECYLFFDSRTNTVRLEQISSNMQVKKTRDLETENALQTGIDRLKMSELNEPPVEATPTTTTTTNRIMPTVKERKESSSSSSSGSSASGSDSSSDESDEEKNKNDGNSSDDDDSELLEKMTAKPDTKIRDFQNISMPVIASRPDCQQLGLNLSESSDED